MEKPSTTNTTNVEQTEPESRQVRRQNDRRAEKQIKKHMNETLLKKNKRRVLR